MVILHAFLALLAGFATMAILVIVVTALLTRLAPDWVGQQGKPGAQQQAPGEARARAMAQP